MSSATLKKITSAHKKITFLYTNNKHTKTKIKNKVLFTIVPKEIKHLSIHWKHSQDLWGENYKMMMKEIKELNKRRDVPYSGIGRPNVVDMLILPKFI